MKNIILLTTLLISSCAFIGHKDNRDYTSTTSKQVDKNISISVFTSSKINNIVGHIKNGWGMETADIEIKQSRTDLIQNAFEQEFFKMGFTLDSKSDNKLITRINQLETELAQEKGGVGYYSICDLQLYLKTPEGIFERNIIENDAIESLWYVTAEEGVSSLYKTVNKCISTSIIEITKKVQK